MTYKDISIKQYTDIHRILKEESDEQIRACKLLDILNKKPEGYYLNANLKELNQALSKDLELLKTPVEPEYKSKFEIDGIVYNVCTNVGKIPAKQYIDYSNILNSNPDDYGLILSVICIPEGKKYGEYDVFEQAKIFNENLDIETATGIWVFFSVFFKSLTKGILKSSAQKLSKNKKIQNQNLKLINQLQTYGLL